MRLHQLAWFLWLVGTVFIALSWTGNVPVEAGWGGFAVALVGTLLSYIPQKHDPSEYPLTQEGFPAEPSGVPVPPDVPLPAGARVLAHAGGKWWRATVLSADDDDEIVVAYRGWDPKYVGRLPRKSLQVDTDESDVPPGPLPEDVSPPASAPRQPDHVRAAEPRDGVRRGDGEG